MAKTSEGQTLEVWFDFASPYSYLSIARLPEVLGEYGVRAQYRPFLLGPVFASQGMNESPFRLFPRRGQYMLRDLARRAQQFGVPYKHPSTFPRPSVIASRVALLGQDKPWGPDFVRAVFDANFVHDRDIGDTEVISELLLALSLPAAGIIAEATTPENKNALKDQVEEAGRREIFGAPTFFYRGEMFWGDDRLEDALRWAPDVV